MKNTKITSPHIDYWRRVWVTAVLLSCLLIAATASASEESDTTPEMSSASLAHDAISNYTAGTCLACHRQTGEDFKTSIHYTWMGNATNVVGKEGNETGKLVAINDFCGSIKSNEALCGKCHAGYGLPEHDFSVEKIDCLICHAPDYAKTATGSALSIDATTAAARNVTSPTREMCLRCHATAGGGDNNKRGDIELGMKSDLELELMSNPKPAVGDLDAAMGAADVSEDLDVHMGGSQNMTCQRCHNFKDNQHHVPGRGMDLRVDDTDTIVSCTNCHDSKPHLESSAVGHFLNQHTDRIYCTVCHITSYGKEATVEMSRDWEHRSLGTNGMHNEYIVRESNPAPIQVWWNRKSEIVDLADPVAIGPDGAVVLAEPVGSISDNNSKIYAARLHLGRQPWDGTHLLPFNVMTVKTTDNMTQAIFDATNETYDPVQYVNTSRYMGIFHGVAPKEDALTCSDCHSDHKLDFEALGYDNIEKDASGKLTRATRPGGDGMNLATLEGLDHSAMISEYTGAETCLGCHAQEGKDFSTSIHYTWMGNMTNVVGKEGEESGKLVSINDFCGSITSNEAICDRCHAGYGLPERDFSVEKIDCLICHAPNYKKTATGPDPSIDATAAAKNVTLPTREMCLRCHATAGGANNNKRGDIELGMKSDLELAMDDLGYGQNDLDAAMGTTDVPKDLDVHMNLDMKCQDCHTFEDHHVSGRGMDLRVDDTNTTVSCENCHGSAPHTGSSIEDSLNNMHTDRLACTVCHITSYGKNATVEMSRDWENRVVIDATGLHKPHFVRESNPAPIQVWWNRKSKIMDYLTDPVVLDSNGVVVMAEPVGSISDPDSKIYAARLHKGRQPWDGTHLLPFNVMIAMTTDNMTQAIVEATGETYNPVQYVNTSRYMGIFHGVSPKEDALTCIDCHDSSHHKLDFEALGYDNIEKDASGNLISATKPGSTLNLATLTEGAAGPGTGEPVSVNISSWTLPSAGTRGTSIRATVNIANTGTETNWFVVSISGAQPTTGYPIVSLGTVQLNAGDSTGVPVMVAVPGSADTGSYTLSPVVYLLDDYPSGDPQAIGSGKSVTIS